MKKLLHCLLGLFMFSGLIAQENPNRCGYENLMHQLMESDPNFEQELKDLDRIIENLEATPNVGRAVITIPVVVHVIHNGSNIGSGSNVSVNRIQSQITILNQDFRRNNSDANETPTQFAGIASDTEIEFCLASTDPNGNSTTGITRHQYNNINNTNFIEQTIKPDTRWNANKYLNIWTVDMPDQTILGYAFPPSSSTVGNIRDGLVINYRNFGFISNSNKGRTTTHEVGHYLGLKHMWGDNDSNGDPIGCPDDDEVSDTPNSAAPYYGCPLPGSSSCGSQDMFMNYMDYTDDNCMNMFTNGQTNVMRGILEGIRAPLVAHAQIACGTGNPGGECDAHNFNASDYFMGFESDDDDQCWIIENRNNDGRTWNIQQNSTSDWGPSQGSGLGVYLWDNNNSGDDYMFSPYLILEAGHEYQLQFDFACAQDENALYPERLEVGFSDTQSSSDFYVLSDDWRFDPVNNAYPIYNRATLSFSANSSGLISLGFHVYSNPDQYAMLIDNVRIKDLGGTTSTSDLDMLEQFSVYPNPTKDLVTVEYDLGSKNEEVTIQVHNLQGVLIKEQIIKNSNKEKIQFNLSEATNGMYFVTLTTDNASTTKKVLLLK